MPLTESEEKEYQTLYRDHALVLLYPSLYDHRYGPDTYTDIHDKHEWHETAKVDRLRELMARRCDAQSATAS